MILIALQIRPFPNYLLPLFSKRVLVQNLSYENEFESHENERVGGTHFRINGFERRLVL